ncbi:MAG TPA: ATP-binding cassette domain-containing protein [Verrucomicrobiae bacterium]|nr:ATP-binding cassette domain-containing protein [Verrucomicrobiae bacterium]
MLRAHNIGWGTNKKVILDGIDLHVHQGECIGLIGPNGSGKSSLLKILACLEKPTTGSLYFRGQDITGKADLSIRRRMAVVFQEALLLDTSVYENVAVGLKIRGMAKPEIAAKVENWLERFGVWHLLRQQARSLSGGEAQRVSLARAFALEPDVLFLDEPFSAMDAPTKAALLTDLAQVFNSTCTTAIIVSHDFREVQRLTQRAVVLINGKVVAEGTPGEILRAQHPARAQEFLSHWETLQSGR